MTKHSVLMSCWGMLAVAISSAAVADVAERTDRRAMFSTALEMAKAGDVTAMADVGARYMHGQGVPKDEKLALQWLAEPAERGWATARSELASYYFRQKQFALAHKWGYSAAAENNESALLLMGIMFTNGYGMHQDYQEANSYLRKAAQLGNASASFLLGTHYLRGLGSEVNPEAGVKLLQFAAEKGLVDAQSRLGFQYYLGEGVAKDYVKAREWLTKAAAGGDNIAPDLLKRMNSSGASNNSAGGGQYQRPESFAIALGLANAGSLSAKLDVGMRYMNGDGVQKDEQQGAGWLIDPATNGSVKAQSELAAYYFARKEFESARKWALLGAKQNDSGSLLRLGLMHSSGFGVPQNMLEANRYFRMAADEGSTYATYLLARNYISGSGIAKDPVVGLGLLKLSAENGFTPAHSRLGYHYFKGDIVEKNNAEAARWLIVAANDGDELAAELLAHIRKTEALNGN